MMTKITLYGMNKRFLEADYISGEFQPGLKFRSAHWAEILLQLHSEFQPGRNA